MVDLAWGSYYCGSCLMMISVFIILSIFIHWNAAIGRAIHSPPFISSIIYIVMDSQIFNLFPGCNPTRSLFICVQVFPALATGSSFRMAPDSLWCASVIFECVIKCSSLIMYYLPTALELRVQRSLSSFIREWYQKLRSGHLCSLVLGVIASRTSQWAELRSICLYTPHVLTSIHPYLSVYYLSTYLLTYKNHEFISMPPILM